MASAIPRLIGMVHLAPLPGSPDYAGSMPNVVADARERANTLLEAGFGGLMVENFGDVPFYDDDVPAATVAAVTACVSAIRADTDVPLGVNILRNDAQAALAVAAATDADFIRVNVLSGSMFTDQGPIVGRAAEVVRLRSHLCPDVRIWADVFVKHAVPPTGLTIEQSAVDTWERGGADALIVSGTGTGHAPDFERFARLEEVVPDAPLVVGSGTTPENVAELADLADHLIVGTALEENGEPGAGLDGERIRRFLDAAADVGLV